MSENGVSCEENVAIMTVYDKYRLQRKFMSKMFIKNT